MPVIMRNFRLVQLSKIPSCNELSCVLAIASLFRLIRLLKMPSGKEPNCVLIMPRPFKLTRWSKMLSGKALKLPAKPRNSRLVRLSKSPDLSPVKPLPYSVILKSSLRSPSPSSSSVIAARCAAVTSVAELTPAAATIASRTNAVRSATGVIALTPGIEGGVMVRGRKSVFRLVSRSK